jgi:hypothetical protein
MAMAGTTSMPGTTTSGIEISGIARSGGETSGIDVYFSLVFANSVLPLLTGLSKSIFGSNFNDQEVITET